MREEATMEFMRARKGYIRKLLILTVTLGAFCIATGAGAATALAANGSESPAVAEAAAPGGAAPVRWDISLAMALAIAGPCIGAGYAVGKVGAAAIGAASEKPELLTRSLLFVALAEGIAIYGLLIALLLYMKL
jgi:F0F1-type ATP synthase membrane subunit c/vacuolar-type H+-ATPase subunit K